MTMKKNTLYSSPQAKKEIQELYLQKLEELAISYEFLTIETSFCNTNIILTGQPDKPPLVLLHGSNGCAPVAIEALLGLNDHFRIYAVDLLGQPNLSAECRLSMKNNDYGSWMYEILARLNIREVTLVGISFGGFVGWKTLVFDERLIAKAFLIVPAGIVQQNPLKAMWKVFLPMQLYLRRKKDRYLQRFLKRIFTEPDEFANNFLSKVLLHFDLDFTPIPLIGKREAQRIKTPLYIIAADDDLLFPGEKMMRRAKQIFPSLKGGLLLKDSKHVPGARQNEQIICLITGHE